jgi:hypothetical protein
MNSHKFRTKFKKKFHILSLNNIFKYCVFKTDVNKIIIWLSKIFKISRKKEK